MSIIKNSDKLEVTLSLVDELIEAQFPQWMKLPIRFVEKNGMDNITFRLGEEMLIRLPSAEAYASKVTKEQKWLPVLAQQLSIKIPEPLAQGSPSRSYPWNWSIYRWIEGKSANLLSIDDSSLREIALDLAKFLREMHKVNIKGAPSPGIHNFYRGGHLSVYDGETKAAISKLGKLIDSDRVMSVWKKAISSKWDDNPVWIHGDLASGNILIKEKRLIAVIDFGGMAIGDPACDLVIAWTFLKGESRRIFQEMMNLEDGTWNRARGWALWKALVTVVSLKDKSGITAMEQLQIIHDVISEHELEKQSLSS